TDCALTGRIKLADCMWLVVLVGALASAQGVQAPANRAIGAVTGIDAGAKQITIKTDAGAEVKVALQDNTIYQRVPPGEKGLKDGGKVAVSDVAVGDRVLARGASGGAGALTATSVVVMSREDLAKKHEADQAEWRKRGVAGVITALNPDSKEITITSRSREGAKPLAISASGAVEFRRYAPDSVRFADAKPSSFPELKVGDQVPALGSRSEDGAHFQPELIVSGAFRNIAATVVTVNAAEKTMKITDLDTKKPALVRIEADSNLRRLQPFVANMLAARLNGRMPAGQRQ